MDIGVLFSPRPSGTTLKPHRVPDTRDTRVSSGSRSVVTVPQWTPGSPTRSVSSSTLLLDPRNSPPRRESLFSHGNRRRRGPSLGPWLGRCHLYDYPPEQDLFPGPTFPAWRSLSVAGPKDCPSRVHPSSRTNCVHTPNVYVPLLHPGHKSYVLDWEVVVPGRQTLVVYVDTPAQPRVPPTLTRTL